MNRHLRFKLILFVLTLLFSGVSNAQNSSSGEAVYNPITTAVPFLNITPDSRHGAMGDAGVATSPDANSQHWNASKFAFIDQQVGFSISYTPWLRQLFHDMNLAYVSGFMKLKDNQTLGASLRYFSVGDIQLTDQSGSNLAVVKPNEFAMDVSYSRKLSEYFSGGVALRYIRSDLSGGIGSQTYVPGNAFATDVSFFFNKNVSRNNNLKTIAAGINISNIGSKISYDNGSTKEFLPANMKLGTSFTTELNEFNMFSFSLDLNKLLVPTPKPGEYNAGTPVINGIFSSFSDAPGGFKEEMHEINFSLGVEYWYNRKFALRSGYFNENEFKGNRKFFSAGAGVKMKACAVDIAYLIPVSQNNPLANTVRFSLIFDLGFFKKKVKTEESTVPGLPIVPANPSSTAK